MIPLDTRRQTESIRIRRPSGEPPPLPKEFDRVAILWTAAFVDWAVIWVWVFLADTPAIWITERDLDLMRPIVENRVDWITTAAEHSNSPALAGITFAVGWTTIVVGLAAKRIRHVLLFLVALSTTALVSTLVADEIGRPRPMGIERIGEWEGFAQPSRPIALLTVVLVGAGQVLVPSGQARRRWNTASAGVVAWFAFCQVYLGVEHPTDGWAAVTTGVAFTLLLFRAGAPEKVFPVRYHGGKTAHLDVTGARGDAIVAALHDQLGVVVTGLTPIGLASSAGSTPLRIARADGPDLFGKLYAQSHLRSDRSYKLGRTLLYGRLEDEQRFSSVRRLVQHEDYMLRVFREAGVDTLEPVGLVEITPDREYLLVTEFLDGASEIGDVEVTDDLIDQGLQAIAEMWDDGLAHRDVKPGNVMVQGDRLRIIDLGFAEIRPSPWREAVDLANMMLVLALRSSPERVYDRATRLFSEEDIAEAFAASRGVTLPSALRADVKRDGRQLLERFRTLAPARRPVAIQRWSIRRIALMLWVLTVSTFLVLGVASRLASIGLWR